MSTFTRPTILRGVRVRGFDLVGYDGFEGAVLFSRTIEA
jgi:hypothetical protein